MEQRNEPSTAEILENFKPELERARKRYSRIKNATMQEITSEMRELARVFDEVFSRIGLDRFNDTSALINLAAACLEQLERENAEKDDILRRAKKSVDEAIEIHIAQRQTIKDLTARAEKAEAERVLAVKALADYEDALSDEKDAAYNMGYSDGYQDGTKGI